jgi:hypothetical protein
MTTYVFRDRERTSKLYAKDFLKENLGTRYYCPNKKCDAYMYINRKDGLSYSYFSAKPSNPHKDGCSYASSNGFDPNKHSEHEFNFDDALAALTMPSKIVKRKEAPCPRPEGEPAVRPLKTIRQIYAMCKSLDYNDIYNGKEIWRMLLDERSMKMHYKGVFGNRIIEGKHASGRFYDKEKMIITIAAPLPVSDKSYKFELKFNDRSSFNEIKNNIFNNLDKIIVIAGSWEKTCVFNVFQSSISSKKQIYMVK